MLAEKGQRVTAVISLEVEDTAMVARVAGRYSCACGEGYHDNFKRPARSGVCDLCDGSEFHRRADDTAETVAARLRAYHSQTAPLITYYAGKGLLERIDAMGSIASVRAGLGRIVGQVTV